MVLSYFYLKSYYGIRAQAVTHGYGPPVLSRKTPTHTMKLKTMRSPYQLRNMFTLGFICKPCVCTQNWRNPNIFDASQNFSLTCRHRSYWLVAYVGCSWVIPDCTTWPPLRLTTDPLVESMTRRLFIDVRPGKILFIIIRHSRIILWLRAVLVGVTLSGKINCSPPTIRSLITESSQRRKW